MMMKMTLAVFFQVIVFVDLHIIEDWTIRISRGFRSQSTLLVYYYFGAEEPVTSSYECATCALFSLHSLL